MAERNEKKPKRIRHNPLDKKLKLGERKPTQKATHNDNIYYSKKGPCRGKKKHNQYQERDIQPWLNN
jgi:hypothetical protein